MTEARSTAVLQAASSRIQAALVASMDRLMDQLPAQAMAATSGSGRQSLMAAEQVIKLKRAQILRAFEQEMQTQVGKLVRPAATTTSGAVELDWSALTLVDNDEVERGVMADRLAQALAPACEEHLKSLYALVADLTGEESAERNPLRPQAVARALLKALGEAGCDEATCLTLCAQLGRLLNLDLPSAYGIVIQDMQSQGLRIQSPTARLRPRSPSSRHGALSTSASGTPSLQSDFHPASSRPAPLMAVPDGRQQAYGGVPGMQPGGGQSQMLARQRAAQALSDMFGVSMPTAPAALEGTFLPPGMDAALGNSPNANAARADFQHLLRTIALQPAPAAWVSDAPSLDASATLSGVTAPADLSAQGFAGPMMAVNLIRAHRDELIRASGGAPIDQIVIDIVAALFDQVLSDPKVAPQMARQIARLQMPVLRVALGDMSFFSSRKHPVRRFVNRVATLSASFDDYAQGAGHNCLLKVTEMVDAIVEGDFEKLSVYEAKLDELEGFIDQESERDAAENAAVAALLSGKEADLRVQQRYMQTLQKELADVELPEFLRDFLTQIWSQVQVMASARDGADSPLAQRMKKAGHDLALSVQPKGHPQLRKAFLQALPQLMKDLNQGLGMIQWPEEAKQGFFAQLLPAHAECLKAAPHHDLTQRMLEQRLNKVEQLSIPSREEAANDPLPAPLQDLDKAPTLTVVAALSQEEARSAGFVPEAVVAQELTLDIDLDAPGGADPSLSEVDINLDVPPPPAAGLQLIHHLQKGAAYQMLMQGQWKKVRLTWVSDGRNFFIFNHGHPHKETVSLTARTLAKMCEGGRFKAFEQAELLERATMRARRQLAALNVDTRTRTAA